MAKCLDSYGSSGLFGLARVMLSACLLLATIPNGLVAETSREKQSATAFVIKLLQFDAARIEKVYEGRPLAGVVVEIESLSPGANATLTASTVTATTSHGQRVPPLATFLTSMDDGVRGSLLPRSLSKGWIVFIGEKRFDCYGAIGNMAVLLETGGLALDFDTRRKVGLGLLFPGNAADLRSLLIVGKMVKLGKPR